MANGGSEPFPLSVMLTQGIEQTRKAMESYLDFFQKNIKASSWLDTDLNEKMKLLRSKILPLLLSLHGKQAKLRISKTSGAFRRSSCKRNGRLSLSRRKSYPSQRLKVRPM